MVADCPLHHIVALPGLVYDGRMFSGSFDILLIPPDLYISMIIYVFMNENIPSNWGVCVGRGPILNKGLVRW